MARPQVGKAYLLVLCKRCNKAFRVTDEPVFAGKEVTINRGATSLTCRGCSHVADYWPEDMRIATIKRA